MARQIALLRGINLGSRNRVAMADLRRLLEDAGHEDVTTLLQSGNVVLTASQTGDALARSIERAIADALGLDIGVEVRSRRQLTAVVDGNPLADVADDPKKLQVSFLSAAPRRSVVKEIEAADLAPERVAVRGRTMYVWHANGIQRSPAARLVADRRLGVVATARNWNTVTKLHELVTA
ncbi:DUF1697 domain-containing protein [Baekduia soli]|uniref:DUF1697 domain-containing protein n=1 Tax=Baekduia soli TaxID=496014 RepID=A0A5B8U412_9ACTN|nr:DUF1697 domain-containing protein [Baekduia soli]QEC47783.1 DUF1697 domain-containing protein [Baekduia soli]